MATSKISRASLRLSTIGLAVAVGAATAVGASGAAAAPMSAPVNYTAKVVGKSVQVDIDRGGFAVERGSLVIRNSGGVPVLGFPLSYVFEGRSYPVLATTSGTTATLTPVVDAAKARTMTPTEVAKNREATVEVAKKTGNAPLTKKGPNGEILHRVGPKNKKDRDDAALKRAISRVSAAMTISSLIGMIVGGIIGGVLAFFVCIGAAATVVGIPFCPPILFLGVSLGAYGGMIVGGGGASIGIVQDYFREINSPFKPEYQRFPQGAPKAKKKN
ncbi:MAG TPA: hypothetical protein PK331_06135 [Gordonia sp. (in: high G+C Gram-positive bacteria)]|uniref:hypothetical protein n=1 Tax=unclassified Gordonia (in: high G+C Gram-positive bacteria) TaxID=2657482 RepID=UPI0025C25DF7|nr:MULTISPECIES: hypothetical protein [unclassified Gordonia (in: high G+C Gram-positive bacteria)]HNP55587.1 hypothetical protein [Gordonia sp. (in: high G+C Gram-positive bacteria)]HRC50488.1 hypothetical protein [Gordonia sp. (in: high G+C Gram-positive bacteria)]